MFSNLKMMSLHLNLKLEFQSVPPVKGEEAHFKFLQRTFSAKTSRYKFKIIECKTFHRNLLRIFSWFVHFFIEKTLMYISFPKIKKPVLLVGVIYKANREVTTMSLQLFLAILPYVIVKLTY